MPVFMAGPDSDDCTPEQLEKPDDWWWTAFDATKTTILDDMPLAFQREEPSQGTEWRNWFLGQHKYIKCAKCEGRRDRWDSAVAAMMESVTSTPTLVGTRTPESDPDDAEAMWRALDGDESSEGSEETTGRLDGNDFGESEG